MVRGGSSPNKGLYYQDVTEKVCTGCRNTLPVSCFRVRGRKSPGGTKDQLYYEPTCLNCEYLKGKRYRESQKGREWKRSHVESKRGDIRFHVTSRQSQWKRKTADCDLDTPYLLDLFSAQNGRCHYSGVPLLVGAKGKAEPNSISLDRLVPDKGYRKGNVAWCSYLVNTMKQQMSEEEFYEFLQQILRHRGLMT